MKRLNKIDIIIGKNSIIAPTVLFIHPDGGTFTKGITIGDNVIIRDGTIIYSDVTIGNGVTVDHNCIIREGTNIGDNSRILNNTEIHRNVLIGKNCRIGGLVANRVSIGDNTTSLGYLIHRYSKHGGGRYEASPIIGDNVIIGRLAIIVGGIKIENNSRIKAGERITKDIKSHPSKINFE